jgi:alpha-1,2-mannosyltransferase
MSDTQKPFSMPLKRFWLPALALALFLLTLLIGNFALPQSKRVTSNLVGHDFLAFYTAGTFIHQNRPHDLYDLQKVQAFQHDLARRENLEIGDSFGPFWNPPFYAPIFAPFSTLPYRTALLIWEVVNIACLIGAIVFLIRILRPAPPRITLLVPMLLVISMPLIQALTHGQNTLISLFLLTVVVTFWRGGRAILAGLTSGLLLYKPQLGALVAVAVVLTLGRRALVGLAVTCLALLLTTLIALPGTISDYLARMPNNLHQFQVIQPYLWDRHVTLRAFWRLLLQGRAAGEITLLTQSCYVLSAAALATLLAKAFWKRRHNPTPASLDCFIAAVIAAMPLLMPFYFDYDLLLISVAAVLYANLRLHNPAAHGDPWLTRLWITLYLWLMVNSTVARLTHINLSVLLLTALAVLLARRAYAVGRVKLPRHPLHPIPESGTVFPRQAFTERHLV